MRYGLGQVVVSAAVDAEHALRPTAARREHEHRDSEARLAPVAQQRQSVEARQGEVEEDCVVGLRARQEIRAGTVAGAVHGVAGRAKSVLELCRQHPFVICHQHSHRCRLEREPA